MGWNKMRTMKVHCIVRKGFCEIFFQLNVMSEWWQPWEVIIFLEIPGGKLLARALVPTHVVPSAFHRIEQSAPSLNVDLLLGL